MNNKRSLLVVISAPSGAGKTTLCKRLLEDFPTLVLSISSTTRAPRGAEKHGVDYFFLSQDEFKKQVRDGRFAEWAEVHGHYYGTSKSVIETAFQSGHSILLDIDVQGAHQLHQTFPNQCLRIFISPPSLEELEKRLRVRGMDCDEAIKKRLNNAKTEMLASDQFDFIIVNDSLERAYKELKLVLEKNGIPTEIDSSSPSILMPKPNKEPNG